MRLILLRHGSAGHADSERWPDDRLRPLTERGRDRVRDVARGMTRLEPHVLRVLSSSLKRCAETAELVREAFEIIEPIEYHDGLAPGGSIRRLLEALPEVGDSGAVMLVGHEPDLGKVAGTLLFGAPAHLPIKKAGGCAIDFGRAARPGAGELAWFLPPRVLKRLARGTKVKA